MSEFIVTTEEAGWVTDIGEFGTNKIIVFKSDQLTAHEWDVVNDMHESDRYAFILAALELFE